MATVWVLTLGSTALLFLLVGVDFKKALRSPGSSFVIVLVAVVATSALAFLDPRVETRGETSWSRIGYCYIAMILGMAAQYFFYKSSRTRFRLSLFLKPFLASPIVFVPLLVVVTAGRVPSDAFDAVDLMLLLVAFQNGFFWQYFFDAEERRRPREPTT